MELLEIYSLMDLKLKYSLIINNTYSVVELIRVYHQGYPQNQDFSLSLV